MTDRCLTSASQVTAIFLAAAWVALGLGPGHWGTALANDRATVIPEPTQPRSTGRRVALVIGNADYQAINPLNNPANDAEDMARALEGLGFEVITAINADFQTMRNRLQEFRGAIRQGSVGLFYFAGHGVQYRGENYLIPVDAPLQGADGLGLSAIPLNTVLDLMRDANSTTNIVILDACRNNPFPGGDRNLGGGLATVQAARGFYIAYATRPGQVASDGTGRNGTYTQALLRHIGTPNLPIEQMFKQVRTEVDQATGGRQLPWDESSLIGDFAFNSHPGNPGGVPSFTHAPASPLPSPSDDIDIDIVEDIIICGASICLY